MEVAMSSSLDGSHDSVVIRNTRQGETHMSQVRVHNFGVSLDGFGTGEGQTLESPFGHAGGRLHDWFFATRTFHAMHGEPGGDTGVDDAVASTWDTGIGAFAVEAVSTPSGVTHLTFTRR